MTELLDIAHRGRTGTVARIGTFPCGNMVSAGSGVRFRSPVRHENVAFTPVQRRH
jgi:hypothetical protein